MVPTVLRGRYTWGVLGKGPRTIDLTIRLRTAEDLFRTPEPDRFPTTGRLVSGIDELLNQLRARRPAKRVRSIILLEQTAGAPAEEVLADLIKRYCDLRLHDLEMHLRVDRRDMRREVAVGLLLFVLGVGLSSEFGSSHWPGEVNSLLGEGVFLVVAWVGLWYPLDHLVFGRRPLRRERNVLRALRDTEVTILRESATA